MLAGIEGQGLAKSINDLTETLKVFIKRNLNPGRKPGRGFLNGLLSKHCQIITDRLSSSSCGTWMMFIYTYVCQVSNLQ